MYQLINCSGDAISVPRLVFSRLSSVGADDCRFRVALYLIAESGGDASSISKAMHLPIAKVETALSFWEGAGLIENTSPAQDETTLPPPERYKPMTTAQVVEASKADPALGLLLQELERLFGIVLGQGEANLFVTLYKQDGFEPELILMAASVAKTEKAQRKAGYTQKILLNWRQVGINTPTDADRYLKMLSERENREKRLAKIMGLMWDPFTRADKRKIAIWFEDYGFDFDMIETACLIAADKKTSVAYIAGMLKKWHGQGYRTVSDINASGENSNLRTYGEKTIDKDDLLSSITNYVPMKKRKST